MLRAVLLVLAIAASGLVAGCELFGGDSAEKLAAARDAEGKAIGGACRHAGRAIEDCFALNKRADKAAVFTGWRDMNDYMRENRLDPVLPQIAATPQATQTAPAASAAAKGTAPEVKDRARPAARTKDS